MRTRLVPRSKDPIQAWVTPAVAAFVKAMRDPYADVRSCAAIGVGSCISRGSDDARYAVAIPPLIELLSDNTAAVRQPAMQALRKFGAKATTAIPRLIELMDDPDTSLRKDAVWSVAAIDPTDKRYEDQVRIMLHDPDADCRKVAAESLKELGVETGEPR
jgi:HEAT repeat protein